MVVNSNIKYNEKWYTDVKVIRFESDVNSQNTTNLTDPGSEGFTNLIDNLLNEDYGDELPF